MSLVELPHPATVPAASIPDHHTASELPSTYNPSARSTPRSSSLSLSIEQTTTTTLSSVTDEVTDDMLSIHSTKSEPFMSAAAPALPAKSALRASRLLATMPQKLPEDRAVLTHAAPHLVYLSSEEDGSSSADDLSDLDSFDSDSEESLDGYSTHGQFARAVSVIFSGKPSVVNLTGRSASLGSLRRPSNDAALRTTSTAPMLGRMRSTSSATSSTTSLGHPPRSSSMTTSLEMERRRPKFLHIDPFAASKTDKDETDSIKTPKTPTAMLSRAFSSLVKKRSRPTLTPVIHNDFVHMEQVGEAPEELLDDRSVSPKSRHAGPPKYYDAMTAAKKNGQQTVTAPATPTSPGGARNGIRGFSLSRRMSVRA
ncbi:hypothetical protein A9K55_001056 [Cordyceps militaris]|uniref:Uncharacterized protein n=1 Tax=Cordyceps militaris TaxID=73501 RepID=A0A2H4SU16_CORMI|nr:hypothetical protein A9K55_001056 [Cordyceps militaris]